MIEIIRGKTNNPVQVQQLVDRLGQQTWNGTLYIGYPILASVDESITIEALLVTEEHGLVAFSFDAKESTESVPDFIGRIKESQDHLYYCLNSNLSRHTNLRKGKGLGFEIQIITIIPSKLQIQNSVLIATEANVCAIIEQFPQIDHDYHKRLNAAIQRVTTIRPTKKRNSVKKPDSKGQILKSIEKEIANLDQWQKKAAIEQPEGIQRIRGLAGSGKTIVLALKAAYLHSQYKNWNIAIIFQTRSLYQQFIDLIRRFTFEHMNDEPNWEKLHILHAWGSSNKEGAYSEMARSCETIPRDFMYAKSKYGMERAFHGICQELYNIIKDTSVNPIYDAVLIDEAQDLPASFLKLIYRFTKEPKRIVVAYDELQSLSESSVIPVAQFLADVLPSSDNINLPTKDIVLPVCYRNTPWAISLAHALGLGIYRDDGLVQFFDDPELFIEIGYELVSGRLEAAKKATIKRSDRSYPSYFSNYLTPSDAIMYQCFDDEFQQANWLAMEIKKNLNEDELDLDDILIILPDAMQAKNQAKLLMDVLAKNNIPSHIAGVTSSQDMIFDTNSIAISNIYRAKGNEAPVVYVLNCEYCYFGREQIKKRNILFTAITRSKAWVRLAGCGEGMKHIVSEIEKIAKNNYQLSLRIPTQDELLKIRRIHRDLSDREKRKIRSAEKGLKEFIEALNSGVLDIESLPPKYKSMLEKYFSEKKNETEFE
jgi:superfamily I DNA and RNA helicase